MYRNAYYSFFYSFPDSKQTHTLSALINISSLSLDYTRTASDACVKEEISLRERERRANAKTNAPLFELISLSLPFSYVILFLSYGLFLQLTFQQKQQQLLNSLGPASSALFDG